MLYCFLTLPRGQVNLHIFDVKLLKYVQRASSSEPSKSLKILIVFNTFIKFSKR
jgi:hypothetical protein